MDINLKRFMPKIQNNIEHIRNIPEWSFLENKKTVMIMVSNLNRAGAQRVACRVASGLTDTCNVVLLYKWEKNNEYDVDNRVKKIFMPHFHYDILKVFSLLYLRKMKKQYRIRVSISFLYEMNYLNLFSKNRDFVIVSERNNPRLAYPEQFRRTKIFYALADHVIFQTEEVRSLYGSRTRRHSSILPNPVAVGCLASDVREKRIVNAARLEKNKNQAMLIRSFALFLPRHPEYRLDIYGEGSLVNELKALAEELKLENSVIFHGNVPDIHEQIADAGMFVLSSNVEGMPNALLEAMMMGLPCISTSCTGAKEVIKDGYNGLLTAIGNVEAMAEAMAKMADNPELAESCRKNAMLTTEAFRESRVMKQWKSFVVGR